MNLELLGAEDMRKKSSRKHIEINIREHTEEELRRFAQIIIDERMKFCREYKEDQPFDQCVCKAINRWIRLFKDRPMNGSIALGNLRVASVEKLFEEMKKYRKIRCE